MKTNTTANEFPAIDPDSIMPSVATLAATYEELRRHAIALEKQREDLLTALRAATAHPVTGNWHERAIAAIAKAASAMGRAGRAKNTPAQKAAARENGRKGGRPVKMLPSDPRNPVTGGNADNA